MTTKLDSQVNTSLTKSEVTALKRFTRKGKKGTLVDHKANLTLIHKRGNLYESTDTRLLIRLNKEGKGAKGAEQETLINPKTLEETLFDPSINHGYPNTDNLVERVKAQDCNQVILDRTLVTTLVKGLKGAKEILKDKRLGTEHVVKLEVKSLIATGVTTTTIAITNETLIDKEFEEETREVRATNPIATLEWAEKDENVSDKGFESVSYFNSAYLLKLLENIKTLKTDKVLVNIPTNPLHPLQVMSLEGKATDTDYLMLISPIRKGASQG